MKPSPPPALKDVRFHNPRLSRVGVEVLTLHELRERAASELHAPQRPDFHLLLLIEAGRGRHAVDFVEHALVPGTVLLVRPGQVQQWHLTPSLQGAVVLVTAEALGPSTPHPGSDPLKLLALDDWAPSARPSPGLFAQAVVQVGRLRDETESFAGGDIACALIRHELMVLLLRLAREREAQAAPPTREAEIHRLFARELESHFHERLGVVDYARRIGYSESTLARAGQSTSATPSPRATPW